MKKQFINQKLIMPIILGASLSSALLAGCGGYNPSTTSSTEKSPTTPVLSSSKPASNPVSTVSTQATAAPVLSTTQKPVTPVVTTRSTQPLATKASMRVDLENRSVKAGDKFTINIVIDSPMELRAGQAGLSFDPEIMKCDEVIEGSFFKEWATAQDISTLVLPKPVIDNTKGKVTDMGVSLTGMKLGGPKGSGILCSFRCTALKDGKVSPKIQNALLTVPSSKDPTMVEDLTGANLQVIN